MDHTGLANHSRDPDRVARRYAGAGQGLAIPEQLVEVMGGKHRRLERTWDLFNLLVYHTL